MKRILLSLCLIGAAIFGHAQVVLNEFFTDPSSSTDKQFFELYNPSPYPVDLSCYTIAAYYSNIGGKPGFYVIDLPDVTIAPKAYYVGASSKGAIKSGGATYTPDFSWNDGVTNLASIGASFKNYTKTNTTSYSSADVTTATDFLFSNNNKYYIFLFDKGNYVNGFLGGNGSSLVSSVFTGMPVMSVSNLCGTFNIDWTNNVKYAEYINSATGNSHGYYRIGNGICGVWNKLTGNPPPTTPKTANPVTNVTQTSSGSITTIENIICNGSKVIFKVTGSSDPGTLPIEVQLYYDNGTPGTLDESDVFQSSITVSSTSNTATYSFDISNKPAIQNILLVYRTSLGCISKVIVPKAAALSLTTTQKNICGNRIDFSVSAASTDATNFGFPVTVQLYQDNGSKGTYEADVDVPMFSTPITLTSVSAATQSIEIPDAYKGQNVIMVYQTSIDCYSQSAVPAPLSGTLTTTQTNICNKRIDFAITGGTGDAAAYALPITVELRNAADNSFLNSTSVSAFSSTVRSLSVPGSPQSVVVVYKPAASCLGDKSATPTPTTAALQVGGLIPFTTELNVDGTRTVSYFVVNTATDVAAFPLELKLYEDVDKDGLINTADKLVGQQTINSVSESLSFTAKITNPNSLAIVTATSVPSGCARATLPLSNSNDEVKILPVHFASFSAMRNKSVVNLKWSTASEQNNRGFNVQRNTGSGWKTIAFVFSLADGGNSNALLSYEYKDANTQKGITQYRIQQVDMDGKASFSDTRSVTGVEKESKVVVYPNPSNDGKVNVVFDIPSVRTVWVSDVAGRVVKEYKNVTSNAVVVAPLAPGFYTIKVADLKSGATAVEKVIIK